MRRTVALVLVLGLVVVARAAGPAEPGRFSTMALGFVLLVAALIGEAGERVKVPRVTAYLLVGLVAGPSMLALVNESMADQLRLVNGLAVALIAFSAGMELDVRRMLDQWRALTRHAGGVIATVFAGVFVAALAVSPWLPISSGLDWNGRIAVALLVAAVMSTFSPTVTMAVLSETRAKGPLTERVLAIVVVGDLGVVVLFTIASLAARTLTGGGANPFAALGHAIWELGGSLVFGLLTGAGVLAYRTFVDRRSWLVVLASCLVLAEVGARVGLSPLLACLVAGVVLRNGAPEAAHAMEELLARARLPVLVVFFAAAGATLHVDELGTLLPWALGIAGVRLALILAGNGWAARNSGIDEAVARRVPAGLLSQAGVTLGLAVIVGREFGAIGAGLETLFLAIVALHELVGPVAFKTALARAGEIPPSESEGAPEEIAAA